MIKTSSIIILCLILLGGHFVPPSKIKATYYTSKDFLSMDGVFATHIIDNSNDSLSDNHIVELKDNNGLTIWFGRFFHKDICTTGVCRMVSIWIFWDGVGNYWGSQFYEDNPLTKSDHTPFELEDYKRFDEIMSDTSSILKKLKYDELTIDFIEDRKEEIIKENTELLYADGYSSATSPLLKEYVIEDAVFTCYTIWHTVYGETKQHIDSILNDRVTPGYINLLINGSKEQQLFALKNINKNKWADKYTDKIYSLITSIDKEISDESISLIDPSFLQKKQNQLDFIKLIKKCRPNIKYEILFKLIEVESLSIDSIELLIDVFNTGDISQGALNFLFKIINKMLYSNNDNNEIKQVILIKLKELENNTDPIKSNLTKSFIKSLE